MLCSTKLFTIRGHKNMDIRYKYFLKPYFINNQITYLLLQPANSQTKGLSPV